MTDLPKNKVPVSISLSLDLLYEVDDFAYYKNQTRSSYIVEAIQEKIQKDKKNRKSN